MSLESVVKELKPQIKSGYGALQWLVTELERPEQGIFSVISEGDKDRLAVVLGDEEYKQQVKFLDALVQGLKVPLVDWKTKREPTSFVPELLTAYERPGIRTIFRDYHKQLPDLLWQIIGYGISHVASGQLGGPSSFYFGKVDDVIEAFSQILNKAKGTGFKFRANTTIAHLTGIVATTNIETATYCFDKLNKIHVKNNGLLLPDIKIKDITGDTFTVNVDEQLKYIAQCVRDGATVRRVIDSVDSVFETFLGKNSPLPKIIAARQLYLIRSMVPFKKNNSIDEFLTESQENATKLVGGVYALTTTENIDGLVLATMFDLLARYGPPNSQSDKTITGDDWNRWVNEWRERVPRVENAIRAFQQEFKEIALAYKMQSVERTLPQLIEALGHAALEPVDPLKESTSVGYVKNLFIALAGTHRKEDMGLLHVYPYISLARIAKYAQNFRLGNRCAELLFDVERYEKEYFSGEHSGKLQGRAIELTEAIGLLAKHLPQDGKVSTINDVLTLLNETYASGFPISEFNAAIKKFTGGVAEAVQYDTLTEFWKEVSSFSRSRKRYLKVDARFGIGEIKTIGELILKYKSTPQLFQRATDMLTSGFYPKNVDGSPDLDGIVTCVDILQSQNNNIRIISGKLGEGGNRVCYVGKLVDDSDIVLSVTRNNRISADAFLREVKALSSLNHENIVRYTSISGKTSDGRPYLVMLKFGNGETLEDYIIDHGLLSVDDFQKVFRGVVNALEYAHQKGIYHGDLTLRNILIERDEQEGVKKVKIGDWESAAMRNYATVLRSSRGSRAYVAHPTRTTSQEKDFYSLGVVMYLALTGKHLVEDIQLTSFLGREKTTDLENYEELVNRIQQTVHDDTKRPEVFYTKITQNITNEQLRELIKGLIGSNWNQGYRNWGFSLPWYG